MGNVNGNRTRLDSQIFQVVKTLALLSSLGEQFQNELIDILHDKIDNEMKYLQNEWSPVPFFLLFLSSACLHVEERSTGEKLGAGRKAE